MSILFKKNRAMKRILRNKFHGAAREPETKRKTEAATAPVATTTTAIANATANAPAYTLSTDIPTNYNDTYVRAIPKDPVSTFIYWEVPAEKARTGGVPDRGNAHVGNDKVHWMQERLGAWNNHHYHHHQEYHRHDNHHRQDNHQWHDNYHRQDNHQWYDNQQHNHNNNNLPHDNQRQDNHNIYDNNHQRNDGHYHHHHHHHTDTSSTATPVTISDILACQSINQPTPPQPSLSSGVFYNISNEKSA